MLFALKDTFVCVLSPLYVIPLSRLLFSKERNELVSTQIPCFQKTVESVTGHANFPANLSQKISGSNPQILKSTNPQISTAMLRKIKMVEKLFSEKIDLIRDRLK